VSKVFVDTNLLAYQFDASEPDKQKRARDVLSTTDHTLVISTQVLLELFVVITRKLAPPLPHQAATQVVEDLSRLWVVSTDSRLVQRAVATSGRHQLSIWDSLIVEAAADAGCDVVWTEDLATGSTIRGVTVVNPLLTD
jgi:predicted nucleic acid-binding protein